MSALNIWSNVNRAISVYLTCLLNICNNCFPFQTWQSMSGCKMYTDENQRNPANVNVVL